MSGADWITFESVVEIVRAHLGCSIGHAQKVTKDALASGSVRFKKTADPVLLMADDGLVGMGVWPEVHGISVDGKPVVHTLSSPSLSKDGRLSSKDDLLDWLGRQYPHKAAAKPKRRTQTKRARAHEAIEALWPRGKIPDPSVLSNLRLCTKVSDWLKTDCLEKKVPPDMPSNDTILRAARRK
jgi:hypothetical protein